MEIKKIIRTLEKELEYKRFEHTLGVAYTASSLAMAHAYDVYAARLAGLLHDCAKGIPDNKKISLCEKNNIEITAVERENPGLLHAKLGAFLARKNYDVEDESILSAITWHTTGKPNMSVLDKICFVADYIEPSRKPLPRIDEIRKTAFTDLDLAVYMILDDTLKYLGQGSKAVDPMTQMTYDFYKEICKK